MNDSFFPAIVPVEMLIGLNHLDSGALLVRSNNWMR